MNSLIRFFVDYYLWIPIVSLFYVGYSYVSSRSNDGEVKWFWLTLLFGVFCPLFWSIVAKYTNRIYLDGMLYDVVVFLVYAITIAICGRGSSFTVLQWIGVAVVCIGFILMAIPKEIIDL